MTGHLSEVVKVRVDAETRAELERLARLADRSPSYLARILIREGLERRQADEEAAGCGR